jgi:predicted sugar kinase
MRLQKDVGMDTLYNFNPLSTEPQDISSFTEVVKTFQHVLGIDGACCEGILCPSTVAHIKQLLSKRSRSMSNIDKRMTL